MPHRTPLALRLAAAFSLIAGALALGACGPPAGASARLESITSPVERAFAPGGRVSMHLSAGQYAIEGSPDDKVHVSWETRDPADMRKASASVTVTGTEASIRIDGPSNGFKVRIAVPARTDLYVRLTAGEVRVKGIDGHKDLSAYAGELHVRVGRADAYRSVDTSVLAGEIQASPFGGSKGGVFRSFRWDGPGAWDLRARLTAGEIQLRD